MLETSPLMNRFQISEEIPSLLAIMSHREWDSEEDRMGEKGGGFQTSVTLNLYTTHSELTSKIQKEKQPVELWMRHNFLLLLLMHVLITEHKARLCHLSFVIVNIATPPTGGLSLFNLYMALSCSHGQETIWIPYNFDKKWFKKGTACN